MERGVEIAMTVDSFSSAVSSLRVFRQDAQIPKKIRVKAKKRDEKTKRSQQSETKFKKCKLTWALKKHSSCFFLINFPDSSIAFRPVFASSVMIG